MRTAGSSPDMQNKANLPWRACSVPVRASGNACGSRIADCGLNARVQIRHRVGNALRRHYKQDWTRETKPIYQPDSGRGRRGVASLEFQVSNEKSPASSPPTSNFTLQTSNFPGNALRRHYERDVVQNKANFQRPELLLIAVLERSYRRTTGIKPVRKQTQFPKAAFFRAALPHPAWQGSTGQSPWSWVGWRLALAKGVATGYILRVAVRVPGPPKGGLS